MALWLLAVVAVLSHIFILAPVVEAQFDPNGPFTSACPYTGSNAFPDRMRALNSVCCIPPPGDAAGGECPGTCNAECIAVLFPLMDDCQSAINQMYDGSDGTYDGEATAFTSIYADCMQVQPEDLIDMLQTLQNQGKCPPTVLDGVGATEVQDAACADVWTGGRCGMSIASGVFSCDKDFCNTVPTRDAPCVVAGQCDSSCHFCGEDGHRRLEAMLAKLKEHRQLQLGNVQCDPATFATEASAVDTACCDDDGSSCANGVPTTCDAKCAVAFNSFYTRCQRFMAAQFSLDQISSYDRLYSTCTGSLPNEPLLRALVVCSSRAPDPCWGMDCGEHGRCMDARCWQSIYHSEGGVVPGHFETTPHAERGASFIRRIPTAMNAGGTLRVTTEGGQCGAATAIEFPITTSIYAYLRDGTHAEDSGRFDYDQGGWTPVQQARRAEGTTHCGLPNAMWTGVDISIDPNGNYEWILARMDGVNSRGQMVVSDAKVFANGYTTYNAGFGHCGSIDTRTCTTTLEYAEPNR